MLKILAALFTRPKARAIVWLHLTHPARWSIGECVSAGSLLIGLFLFLSLFWYIPQPDRVQMGDSSQASCTSIVYYGGKGDNATDNSGPLSSALSAQNCVSFPPGQFVFTSSIQPPTDDMQIMITANSFFESDNTEAYMSRLTVWSCPTTGHLTSCEQPP
jgi:hypothetical protein